MKILDIRKLGLWAVAQHRLCESTFIHFDGWMDEHRATAYTSLA